MSRSKYLERQEIGGILILFLVGLALTMIRTAYSIFTEIWPIFSDGRWEVLTTRGSPAYHQLWAPVIFFEGAGNLLVLIVGVMTLALMLRKSKLTPVFAITYVVLASVVVFVGHYFANLIPAVAAQSRADDKIALYSVIIYPALWIPYFLISERVKATFVK